MGWKGTLRSVVAAGRAADREAQRRHKQSVKVQMVNEAAEAVENWEAYVSELVSIHTSLVDEVNWQNLASVPCPEQPSLEYRRQEVAKKSLSQFGPSAFHVFRGGSKKLKQKLEENFAKAKQLDAKDSADALRQYKGVLSEWQDEVGFANRLLSGDVEAMKEVISELKSLSEESLIGSHIGFSFGQGLVHAEAEIHQDEIVPKIRRKQLASGKLSESKMPAGQFNELYQDYVSSVALRIAGDLFRVLPLNEIYVTCVVRMLNSQTGHQELTPVLSVQFVKDTFLRLNLKNIDPSDSMKNFRHEMNFSRTKGMLPVAALFGDSQQ